MSLQARPAAVRHQQAAATQIRTELPNSRLPSSYVSNLSNVHCRVVVVDGPVVAEEDFLVPAAVVVDQAAGAAEDDPAAVAEADAK